MTAWNEFTWTGWHFFVGRSFLCLIAGLGIPDVDTSIIYANRIAGATTSDEVING
jgi:hypothetical protein